MAELTMSGVIRKFLAANIEMPADVVVRRAIAKGITASEKSIRANVHNLRSAMKKEAAAARPAPSAARETAPPKIEATPAPEASDLGGVLANVALVSKIVSLCGGVENARKAAEAVNACGSTAAFLQHLDLVASIRVSKSTG